MAEELKKDSIPAEETSTQEETARPEETAEQPEEKDDAPAAAAEEAAMDVETDSDEIEEPIAEENGKEKKGLFKKKKDKRDEEIAELKDKNLRQMAEFNNFRNRSEKEKAQMFDLGSKNVIEKILPIIDNFERGLAMVPEDQKEDAFVAGMEKVYKQLTAQLEALDVKPIEAVGQEFNPDFHNAVMQVESQEYESGMVAQEFQKGYTYKGSVVRHSMVAVVQ